MRQQMVSMQVACESLVQQGVLNCQVSSLQKKELGLEEAVRCLV